jgi:glycosyltransferase involved in cell wall biosynthesis
MRTLLIEPYYGGSHRAWADGYARYSAHSVDLLTLPARFWKWRMQGAAVTLAVRAQRREEQQPDLILASDMLNLPAFLALVPSLLDGVPVVLYCHENQLTYPLPPGEKRDLTYAMINWLSMLVADRVFFNSRYHLQDWFEELPRLLKHFPDYTHLHRIPAVRGKSSVLPVGCDLQRFDRVERGRGVGAPLILWNQRWEYDKDPHTFFLALDVLTEEGIDFRVALAGSNVRQMPEEFEAARERLGERVVHYGRADEAAYVGLLKQADVVVSTALHEFFGIAIVEAIYSGCFPVLPRRLAYPEILPEAFHERCLYGDFEGLLARLRWALGHTRQAREVGETLGPAMARFDWRAMAPAYDAALGQVSRSAGQIGGVLRSPPVDENRS